MMMTMMWRLLSNSDAVAQRRDERARIYKTLLSGFVDDIVSLRFSYLLPATAHNYAMFQSVWNFAEVMPCRVGVVEVLRLVKIQSELECGYREGDGMEMWENAEGG